MIALFCFPYGELLENYFPIDIIDAKTISHLGSFSQGQKKVDFQVEGGGFVNPSPLQSSEDQNAREEASREIEQGRNQKLEVVEKVPQ